MLPPSIEYKYGVAPLNAETVIPPLHLVPVLQLLFSAINEICKGIVVGQFPIVTEIVPI